MMAVPFAGALVGAGAAWGLGFTSLSALTLGASAGWMVGSWVMYSQMDPIGGGNEVLDPGAQEMPRFNTAVRGAIVPVLFGTNRVPSQIVWQQNFEAIRNETSSAASNGGKSGGSGGGKGVQTGGSVQVSYTYKIDAVYHLGLVPKSAKVLGGWLGGERINDASISSLGLGSSGDGFQWVVSNPADGIVGIQYDEGIFFEGFIDEENDWDWLTSQVGGTVCWPGTVWVGFKGLSMGTTASMPQLSFEVGAAGSDFQWVSAYRGQDRTGNAGYANNPNMRVDRHGNAWSGSWGEAVQVVSNMGAHLQTYSQADMLNRLIADTGDSYFTPGWYSNFGGCGMFVAGGFEDNDRILIIAHTAKTGGSWGGFGTYHWWIGSYEPSADGTLTYMGHIVGSLTLYPPEQVGGPWTPFKPAGQDNASPMCFQYTWGSAAVGAWSILVVPSINAIEGDMNGDQVHFHWHDNSAYMQDWIRPGQQVGVPLNQARGTALFILPRAAIDPLVSLTEPVYRAGVYRYVPRGLANAAASHSCQWYEDKCVGDFANGGLAMTELSIVHDDDDFVGASAAVSHNLPDPAFQDNVFIDTNGNGYDYFDDEWVTFLGDETYWTVWNSTPKPPAYQFTPGYYKRETSGAYTIGFVEPIYTDPMYSDPAYVTAGNFPYCLRVRFYTYNPSPDVYKFYEQTKIKGYMCTALEASMGGAIYDDEYDALGGIVLDREVDGSIIFYLYNGPAGSTNDNSLIVGELGSLDNAGSDEYPPYIIRQILVNGWFGLQPGGDIIDETSYAEAITYCEDNNIRVSTQYRRDQEALTQIELLLSLYGGWLSVLPSEGKIKFGVLDLQNDPVRTLDNSHLLIRDEGKPPVTTVKGALQDTYNVIRVNYIDRDLMYEQNQVEDRDEVDEDLTGTRTREFPAQFVMTRELAQWIATRALWSNLYTRDRHQFYLGWQDADLEPGDKVTLVDSFSPGGLNQVCQIVRWNEVERGVFEVLAVQQLPYISGISPSDITSASMGAINGGGTWVTSLAYWASSGTLSTSGITTNPSCGYISNKNGPVAAPEFFQAYELPNEFHQSDPQVFVGWRAAGNAYGADLYVSADNVSFAPVLRATPYPLSGKLLTSIGSDANVVENVNVVLHPGSGYAANSPTYWFNATLNDVDAAAMKMGAGLLWVGSEMLAYRNVTVISQNTYRLGYVYRGWGGTHIHAHNSGDNWHKHGGGIFNYPYTEDQIGSVLYYKVVPFNAAGYSYNVSSVTAQQYTVQGAYYKPQIASAVEFMGTERGLNKLNVGSEADIPISWKDSARRSGWGTGGYGQTPSGYGAFITDTLSHSWRVLVVGSGNVVVRSTTTGSTGFTYTNSMNAADNGAWRGNVAFKVTPFSPYGDAPRTSVISMELFK